MSGPAAHPNQVSGPQTPTVGSPLPRGPSTNELSNEPVQPKVGSTLGFACSAPSHPYSVVPNTCSSSGNSQQSQSTPVMKIDPPSSAAALQPPVPGQSSGTGPSYSYGMVPPHVGSASAPKLQTGTVAGPGHGQGGKVVPPNNAASLQPPVPGQSGRPNQFVLGTIPQNIPAPMQSPISVPKGNPLIAAGFSFGGSAQLTAAAEFSQTNQSSNPNTSAAAMQETGTVPAASTSSQLAPLPFSASPNVYPMTMWTQSGPVPGPPVNPLPGPPGMPVIPGTPGPPGMPSQSLSSATNPRPPVIDPSASLRPMPSPAPLPPTSAAVGVHPPMYPSYHSLPAMGPPQGQWLQPPQVSGMQRPPYMPYPSGLPAPYPLPARGVTPFVAVPDSQPPGVSPLVPPSGTPAATLGSGHPASNAGAQSPPPGIVQDKQADAIASTNGDTAKNEDAGYWTTHRTERGAVYYYNSLTGESTYERPSCFKGEPDKGPNQSTPVSTEKLAGTDWVLVSTNDGRKYYHNTKTKVSSWLVPQEVAELRKKQDNESLKPNTSSPNASISIDKALNPSLSTPAINTGGREATPLRNSGVLASSSTLDLVKKKLQDAGAPVTSSPNAASAPVASDLNGLGSVEAVAKGQQSENSKEKPKDGNGDGNVSDDSSDSDVDSGPTKEECIIQFKEMLKERGVAPFSKWEKELPKILFDPRFKAVPGYATRRALFEHYVRTRAEEERKEKRAAQKAAIEGFKQLLEEASEGIDHNTDYHTFKRKWGNDPRFEALDRKDREALINERVLPLKKAAEEKIKKERAASVLSFKSMLRDCGEINATARWSRVKDSLRDDPRYKSVRHEEREALFNEYLSELKAAEDEAERAAKAKKDEQEKLKEREREMRKRKEREEQEMERVRLKVRRKEAVTSYQALLVETIKDPKASWTESRPKLEKDPQGRATNPDLDKSDAEKLFRDHVKMLHERCAREFRALVAEVITAETAARVSDDGKTVLTSWSEAKRLLKPDPRYSKMPRKDRESLWRRLAEEIQRKQKPSDLKEDKPQSELRNKTSADSERSPRRSHSRR